MPEKPKRRKNNKNKRKNKNNKPDSSKNDSDVKKTDISESCSSHNDNEGESLENKNSENVVDERIVSHPESVVETVTGTCSVEINSSEDQNNNNSSSQLSNESLLTVENVPDIDSTDSPNYVVESPDQSLKNKGKLNNSVKSKSLDNDDATKIEEIIEESVASATDDNSKDVVDSNNVIITDVESDVEWEKTDDLGNEKISATEAVTGVLSITTLPLTVAQCEQTKSLTAEEEKSLRNYLKTLNLSTQPENINSIEIKTEIEQIINHEIRQRLRKKGLADDFFVNRLGPPRMLDVIDEEGSGESSITSRRQSYLSEKKSDVEDLEDDVFEEQSKSVTQNKVAQLNNIKNNKSFGRLLPQECVLVGAKLTEPAVTEARGDWTVKTVEKMTGAELVYLTDTSSSTSSLHDIGEDDDGIDTDVSVRMITPTIEVTDTENFLKKTFISNNSNTESKLQENNKQEQSNKLENMERIVNVKIENDFETKSLQSNCENTGQVERIINIAYEKTPKIQNPEEHIVKMECKNDFKTTDMQSVCEKLVQVERIINIEHEKESNISNRVMDKKTADQNITPLNIDKKENIEKIIPIKFEKDTKTIKESNINEDCHSIKNVELKTVLKSVDEISKENTKHFFNNTNERIDDILKSEHKKYSNKNEAKQNSHEIIVLSTDNIKTNLYVKEIDDSQNKQNSNFSDVNGSETIPIIKQNEYDLEAKVIKCEFNDAINNLIKEVSSDSEIPTENNKNILTRQDSSSSISSSQCTAKYNPNYSSLNDMSTIMHDETSENNKSSTELLASTTSHVKDVFDCVTGATTTQLKVDDNTKQPSKLKDLCVGRIATFPYGEKILEELASVSQRLQNITVFGSKTETNSATSTLKKKSVDSMPHYPLTDVSSIEKSTLPVKTKSAIPPPVQPRHSSLKKSQEDEHRTGVPTKSEPVYMCLSPSQKMLMEKTNTVITKEGASHLVDMHRKFVDRRGYTDTHKLQKQRDESDSDNPPVIPFKSQTGSRLLALIRDPTLTRNISSLNQRLNNSLEGLQNNYSVSETFSKCKSDRLHSVRDYSFKPIPPPRPKKFSTSFYESDESSDFTDNSMRSVKNERKYFHYSTGNLNKEIENDISSIQNMHRFYTSKRDESYNYGCPRRPSLPKDLCEQQMEYIRKKEKEVEAEIQRLETLKTTSNLQTRGPRAPLISEKEMKDERINSSNSTYFISHKKDIVINPQTSQNKNSGNEDRKLTSLFSSSQEELLRDKMYSEYVTQMAERQERKQHKIIKISNTPISTNSKTVSKSMPTLDILDSKVNNRIEKEFISKARERWDKLGIKDPETEDERDSATNNLYKEPKVIEHKIKVIEGGEVKDVRKLPDHIQEFVRFTAKDTDKGASSSGESEPGPASPHLVIMCAVIIIVLAVGKYFLRLLRNK